MGRHKSTGPDVDPEVEAISKVNDALSGLENDVVQRVLRWALSKYSPPGIDPEKTATFKLAHDAETVAELNRKYDDVATIFTSANPKTDNNKALVVGYWLQFVEGIKSLDSQRINQELKHLGHGVVNITRTLDRLIAKKPSLVIQIKKAGKTKQARKKYKLTEAGRKAVEAMLNREDSEG